MKRLRVTFFTVLKPGSACSYLRTALPFSGHEDSFELAWDDLGWSPDEVRAQLDRTDLVVIQRDYLRQRTLATVREIFKSGLPVIFEIDDLLSEMPEAHPDFERFKVIGNAIRACARAATAVTVTTPVLAEAFSRLNPNVYVLPNLVDERLWQAVQGGAGGPVTIGYAGTATHEEDLVAVEEALLAISEKYGDGVRFRFYGCCTKKLEQLPGVEYVAYNTDYLGYVEMMNRCGFDIAIAPLVANKFNRCKSNIKWLEYSAASIAGVYSRLEPYIGSVVHGQTGLLASGTGEWVESLGVLIENASLRKRLASTAKASAGEGFSLESSSHLFCDVYRDVAKKAAQPGTKTKTFRKPTALYNDDWFQPCRALAERVVEAGVNEVIIYGAGLVGMDFAAIAEEAGLEIACVVDSNPSLWGRTLKGVKVCSLEEAAELGVDAYVVASFSFAQQIEDRILSHYEELERTSRVFTGAG